MASYKITKFGQKSGRYGRKRESHVMAALFLLKHIYV